jgi:hypothetical protein
MQEKYQAKIHHKTIWRWAYRYGWVELWDNAIKEGTLRALKELEENQEYQEFRKELLEDYKKAISSL